jgi:hypothetical protein
MAKNDSLRIRDLERGINVDLELADGTVEGQKILKVSSGSSGGGAATIADGADVTQGALADAANTTGTTGTVSGKLRGMVQHLATLLTRLPAALGGHGGLVVEGVASGTAVPVSGTVTADTELAAAAARADALANPTVPTVGAALSGFNGASWDRLRTPTKFVALAAVAIGSIATVWTPAGGKKFRLMGGSISVSAAVSILFEDNAAGTTIIQLPKLLADTPYNFDLGNGVLSGAADRVLKATSSAAASATGYLYGCEE